MEFKKTGRMLGVFAALATVAGCATSNAPMGSGGGKIEILVLSDRGNPAEMEAKQWGYRNEVGSWMEMDLLNRLRRTGYDAKLVQSKDEFVPAKDRYLVSMAIKSYNPGSTAARMLVGMGAGSCSLDMHYAVFGQAPAALMEWDDGIGTSGDWRRLPNALNDRLVRKLNTDLASTN